MVNRIRSELNLSSKKLIFFLMIFLIAINIVCARENIFEQILEPVRGFNLEELYSNYGHFIDFAVYLFIFVTIARIALAKRFEAKEANILAGALGVVLSISLALTERTMGFNLRSFGPIAALIIILFVGFILYTVIHHIGGGKAGSGAIAFVIVYFLIRAVSPTLFSWLEQKAPFIHGVLGIAVIIAIWQAVASFVHLGRPSLEGIRKHLEHPVAKFKERALTAQELASEKRIIKGRLEKVTKRERKQAKEIIVDLKEMIKIIEEHGETAHGRELITQKLQDIVPREHDLLQKLTYLKNLDEWLRRFDFRQFKELGQKYAASSKEEKSLIRKEILEQRKKMNIEVEIENLNYAAKKYEEDFRYCLNMIVNYLNAAKLEEAEKWLYKAIECEKETAGLLKKMNRFEDLLLKLTRIEIKLEAKK